jgi:hypothetical protein
MKRFIIVVIVSLLLTACQPNYGGLSNTKAGADTVAAAKQLFTPTPGIDQQGSVTVTPPPLMTDTPIATVMPTATVSSNTAADIPNFDHIVLIMLENEDYEQVIGNPQMPNLNALATQNVTLSNYYAIGHPSLPNYIALMSGGTQNITSDCNTCFVNQKNLADLIMASGRTWKAYEENMPSPCFIGDSKLYAQKHDPLLYFDSIRTNSVICKNSIVPLTQLDSDLAAKQMPNFAFIMPNLCNSGHDCALDKPDAWVQDMVAKLQASPAFGSNSLIAIIFDEGQPSNKGACCGLASGGGKVAAILISPLAKPGFNDDTEYSHYSLLKTILAAWNLPGLGMTNDPQTPAILAPWIHK